MTDHSSNEDAARKLLRKYSIRNSELLVIGAFDVGVTVLSQQIRAMNLAWALIEGKLLDTKRTKKSAKQYAPKVAIVGAGFAGLSLAAALLRKGVRAEISLFEKRDTLLPLQQGSDSRWLHPNIYDWPIPSSETSSASLPLLNWTAGRASDVVVQVLRGWEGEVSNASDGVQAVKLYCNVGHLQIREEPMSEKFRLEWVGERRDPKNGIEPEPGAFNPSGSSKAFDLVALAVGFGLEADQAHSYWRNETLAQPHLHVPTQTYVVSGQGDGAMIDLLRLRVSQFRQDRILSELFAGAKKFALMKELRRIHKFHEDQGSDTFANLERLFNAGEATEILDSLRARLRQDTKVFLHLKVKRFSDLFADPTIRLSFQNKLMAYLLYKCGGFSPVSGELPAILAQHGIPNSRVITRHGADKDALFKGLLSAELFGLACSKSDGVDGSLGRPVVKELSQPSHPLWSGGYFGYEGREDQAKSQADSVKRTWRREYLPSPTTLLAANLSAAVAGLLAPMHEKNKRLRVSLHRVIRIADDWLLQQACDYSGVSLNATDSATLARTFPAHNATVGLAFRTQKIVRSDQSVSPTTLRAAMRALNLNDASRKMADKVRFVSAIPLLFRGDTYSGVCGVLYIDSSSSKFFINDQQLIYIGSMCESFLQALFKLSVNPVDRIMNYGIQFSALDGDQKFPPPESAPTYRGLEQMVRVSPPILDVRPVGGSQFLLNFEHVDFLPVASNA